MNKTRAGLVALVGRPNVGKSTLLNALVGEKVSIVTPKPQTTRHRIIGLLTEGDTQIGFVDTPGIHAGAKRALNRLMNKTAVASLEGVDLCLFLVEAGRWTEEDALVLERLKSTRLPLGLVVNKIDRVKPREKVLPYLKDLSARHAFAFIVPTSASRRENLEGLLSEVRKRMPEAPFLYDPEQLTDRSQRFMVSELVREKLMLSLQQELPYSLTVEIEKYAEENGILHISAVIWVEREGHKAIVIGSKGALLKRIGSLTRIELEKRLEQKVFLQLWVKVKEGWADDERALRSLGYESP
jgi:GTP-binding protein Era